MENHVTLYLYFFALEIYITFDSVKENFRIDLVFEINLPKKIIRIFIFWTKYQYYPWNYEPQDGNFPENRDFPQL